MVIHNPNAKVPLPEAFFERAQEHWFANGSILSSKHHWHPNNSQTIVLHVGELKQNKIARHLLGHGPRAIASIDKEEFYSYVPSFNSDGGDEGWFSDESRAFLGVVVRKDTDYKALVFARDTYFVFTPINERPDFATRSEAVEAVQLKLLSLLSSPCRIFKENTN